MKHTISLLNSSTQDVQYLGRTFGTISLLETNHQNPILNY